MNVTTLENPMHRIVPGAVVRLRSGGPAMTVRQIGGDVVVCCWHTESGSVEVCNFSARELEFVK